MINVVRHEFKSPCIKTLAGGNSNSMKNNSNSIKDGDRCEFKFHEKSSFKLGQLEYNINQKIEKSGKKYKKHSKTNMSH